jgi:hypothetical protein
LLTTNALHFDPTRIQPADGGRLAGEQRVALFTVAGLIEVTPESMREWNREVLAGYRRRIESDSRRPLPRWGDLMTKLLSFPMQRGRQSYEDIADHCNGNGAPIFPTFHRLNALVHNRRTPTEVERLALYRYAGLDAGQIAAIENDITTGRIPLGFARRRTPSAAALHSILDKLAAQGGTLTQLALRSALQHAPDAIPVSQSNLSAWRYGRELPTLASLRALTEVLRQVGPGQLANPVLPAEIDGLLRASGFHPRDLTDTTHQIIDRIGEFTGHFLEEGTWKQAKSHALRAAGRFFHAQIRPRPYEAVSLGEQHPGSFAIQTETFFCRAGNLDGKGRIKRWSMSDRQYRYDAVAFVRADNHHDGARTAFHSFFLAPLVFPSP